MKEIVKNFQTMCQNHVGGVGSTIESQCLHFYMFQIDYVQMEIIRKLWDQVSKYYFMRTFVGSNNTLILSRYSFSSLLYNLSNPSGEATLEYSCLCFMSKGPSEDFWS